MTQELLQYSNEFSQFISDFQHLKIVSLLEIKNTVCQIYNQYQIDNDCTKIIMLDTFLEVKPETINFIFESKFGTYQLLPVVSELLRGHRKISQTHLDKSLYKYIAICDLTPECEISLSKEDYIRYLQLL